MSDKRTIEGFSLVEVIAALVIASMSLIVLMRGMGSTQRATLSLEEHLGARVIADSLLEDERQAPTTVTGTRSGDSGLYTWQLDVEPARLDGVPKSAQNARLYRLTATITWPPRGRLVLDTLKLGQ